MSIDLYLFYIIRYIDLHIEFTFHFGCPTFDRIKALDRCIFVEICILDLAFEKILFKAGSDTKLEEYNQSEKKTKA